MPENLHKILLAAIIFMYSGSFVQNGFLPVPIAYVNFVAMALTAILILSNLRACFRLTWGAKGILLLTLLAIASSLWSVSPDVTFRRSLILAGRLVLAFILRRAIRLRSRLYFIVVY